MTNATVSDTEVSFAGDAAGLLKVASCHQVCSYETLDVDDPESSYSAVIASAAIAMRIELEWG